MAIHEHTRARFAAVTGTNTGVGLCVAGPLFSVYESIGPIPIQASCNDIYAIKRDWGDCLCLFGNMNIEGVLFTGTPEEVAEDTKEHIDRLSSDGGYVVQSSHSIVDAIPTKNYLAMIEATIRYGIFEV